VSNQSIEGEAPLAPDLCHVNQGFESSFGWLCEGAIGEHFISELSAMLARCEEWRARGGGGFNSLFSMALFLDIYGFDWGTEDHKRVMSKDGSSHLLWAQQPQRSPQGRPGIGSTNRRSPSGSPHPHSRMRTCGTGPPAVAVVAGSWCGQWHMGHGCGGLQLACFGFGGVACKPLKESVHGTLPWRLTLDVVSAETACL